MEQAAALHGPRWNDASLRDHAFLNVSGAREFVIQVFPDCLAEFHRRYDGVLEPEYMAVCDRYGALVGKAMDTKPGSFTLTHGDFRLDNMLFDARGGEVPLAVLDWQSPAIGIGAAMAICSAIMPGSGVPTIVAPLDRLAAELLACFAR